MDEKQDIQEKTEQAQISVAELCSEQITTAIGRAAAQALGYETDKGFFELMEQIGDATEKYTKLRQEIIKKYGTQTENGIIIDKPEGLEELNKLHKDLGVQKVELQSAPVKVDSKKVLLSGTDRIILKKTGLVEFING